MPDQVKYANKLQGKNVLVIGGSSGSHSSLSHPYLPRKHLTSLTRTPITGIGYAVAEASLEFGCTVTISSSNPDRVAKAVSKLQASYPSASNRISGHACNLGDEETLESNLAALLDETTAKNSNKLDHVVFTAGDALASAKLADVDMAFIKKAGMVRFFAPMLLGKLLPTYTAPGPDSSYTITTGAVSEHPIPDWSVVGSYATGLHGLTRQFALDLKPLRVNLISPGAVETELWDGLPEEQRGSVLEGFAKKMATGRVGRPEDVAEGYLYCMRDGNLTGSVVSSNGGSLVM
jgi:NAD(P)-dependent dehydrogenase (short-subunit alcohol dehydrogenase family)